MQFKKWAILADIIIVVWAMHVRKYPTFTLWVLSVGKAVTEDPRDPRFVSQHRQNISLNFCARGLEKKPIK